MSDFIPYAVSVEDMMRARDERVHAQNEMLAAAASFPAPTALLSFGMNIPGAVKQTPLIRSGFLFGKERLTELLHREDYALLRTRELRRVSGDS
ncbi:citrate lyase holo-[acyl-carrier protein] synthase, partial [Stomatobaculum longum]